MMKSGRLRCPCSGTSPDSQPTGGLRTCRRWVFSRAVTWRGLPLNHARPARELRKHPRGLRQLPRAALTRGENRFARLPRSGVRAPGFRTHRRPWAYVVLDRWVTFFVLAFVSVYGEPRNLLTT